jgi:hypothetical protein
MSFEPSDGRGLATLLRRVGARWKTIRTVLKWRQWAWLVDILDPPLTNVRGCLATAKHNLLSTTSAQLLEGLTTFALIYFEGYWYYGTCFSSSPFVTALSVTIISALCAHPKLCSSQDGQLGKVRVLSI